MLYWSCDKHYNLEIRRVSSRSQLFSSDEIGFNPKQDAIPRRPLGTNQEFRLGSPSRIAPHSIGTCLQSQLILRNLTSAVRFKSSTSQCYISNEPCSDPEVDVVTALSIHNLHVVRNPWTLIQTGPALPRLYMSPCYDQWYPHQLRRERKVLIWK